MRLLLLRLRGWRNLEPLELELGRRATVLHGQNGQGKTNLVEAIHYLLTFRSFRTKSSDDLVRWDGGGAKVEADVEVGELVRRLTAELSRERKTFNLDGKPVRRDAPGLAGVGVVLFVPEDLLLPRSSPAERRRFLDVAVFGLDRTYYREAYAYQRILKNRNATLKRGPHDAAMLDAYDEELSRAGARIVMRRRAVTAALEPRFRATFGSIHEPREVGLAYASHEEVSAAGPSELDVAAALRAGLGKRRMIDLRRGFTGFGPHTDDLAMTLDGRPARDHASQGQTRSLVLALKLAELQNLTETLGHPPLLLLDDVASELDATRRTRLFETIASLPGQTVITVTDPEFLPRLSERVDFAVASGRVTSPAPEG